MKPFKIPKCDLDSSRCRFRIGGIGRETQAVLAQLLPGRLDFLVFTSHNDHLRARPNKSPRGGQTQPAAPADDNNGFVGKQFGAHDRYLTNPSAPAKLDNPQTEGAVPTFSPKQTSW